MVVIPIQAQSDLYGHHAWQEAGGAGRPKESTGDGGEGEAGRTALVEAEGASGYDETVAAWSVFRRGAMGGGLSLRWAIPPSDPKATFAATGSGRSTFELGEGLGVSSADSELDFGYRAQTGVPLT